MPHGQGVWDVDEIPHRLGKPFEVGVLCLKPHCPMANKWAKPKYVYCQMACVCVWGGGGGGGGGALNRVHGNMYGL